MVVVGVVLATIAAFLLSFLFYAVAPAPAPTAGSEAPAEASRADRPRPGQILVELLRSAIVAVLLAGLLLAAGWSGPASGALLGGALWALPVVLLAGSVLWEKVPIRSAGLHAGDWLLKLVLIGAILGLFT